MQRKQGRGVICFCFLLLWWALTPAWGSGETDNTLCFGIHTSDIGSLDPHFVQGSQDMMVADMVFNGLVRYTPGDSGRLEPDLAVKIPEFTMENGRQIWHVTLRKGVMFHAGPRTPAHELTADDVVYSLTKAADSRQSLFYNDFKGITVKKTGRYHLHIILETPVSPLFLLPVLADQRGGLIVSKRAMETMGQQAFSRHPVGTGPFYFHGYTPGKKLHLKAHDAYFRGQPNLDGVSIRFIPNNRERRERFARGELDVIIGSADKDWLTEARKIPNASVDVFGPGYTGMFHLNTQVEPFNDIRVRYAVFLALDRAAFLADCDPQIVQPVMAPMPRISFPVGMTNDQVAHLGLDWGQDLEKARHFLAEAGYADGFDLSLFVSEKRLYRQTYESLKQQLAKVGIRVALNRVSHSEMHRRIRQDENPMVLYFTIRPNPDHYMRGFFHSSASQKGGRGTHFSHYNGVDALLDDALASVDLPHQIQLWNQAQVRILYDAVAYPLYNVRKCILRRNDLVYGHALVSTRLGYPQFTETTQFH